ncbi:recombination protein NinB [Sphingobium olei]|uniref:Recombination protein NinB n=1 Tax=Sphingobium olei TaxID=420955 RepID=A0ABW3P1C1_9SPHN
MANGQTIILNSPFKRAQAQRLIEQAPQGAILNIKEAKRTSDQNALLWALLSQISRAKPDGRMLDTDTWKALFMHSVGFKCTFEPTLDGQGVVPLGYRSSRLTKLEFSDLIEAIFSFAAEKGIALSDEIPSAA